MGLAALIASCSDDDRISFIAFYNINELIILNRITLCQRFLKSLTVYSAKTYINNGQNSAYLRHARLHDESPWTEELPRQHH